MRFLILSAALLATAPATAQTAPQIAAMRQSVAADTERNQALLQRLVDQNSGTLNLAGVRATGDMLVPEFRALGFDVEWIEQADVGRAGHLVARKKGNGRGKRLLLIAHLDTVFEPDSPFQGYSVDGNRATGPGVGDDKGGIVVILAALRAMQAAGTLRNADITVFLAGDEERTGAPAERARASMVEAARNADIALEYENMAVDGGTEYGTVARRSSTSWELRATGVTGHSSGVFGDNLGYGAIYEMARILDAFRRELPEPNLTYNVGVMAGGTPAAIDQAGVTATGSGKTNIVAEAAIARGDLRTLTPEQDARVRARMDAIVAQHLPRTSATLTFFDVMPPMAPSEGNRALLATLNAVNRDLGLPEMPEFDPARRGAADSGWVADLVPTLAGLGVSGGGAHAEGEWIDLESIPRQALRNAAFLTRLSREPRAR